MITAQNRVESMNKVLYANPPQSNEPHPMQLYLKVSNMGVNGLSAMMSRYLVVSADMINPHDMAWNAVRNIRNGNNSRAALTCSEAPFT